MAIEYKKLYNILKSAFPNDEISLVDTAGDSNHYEVTIESSAFAGLSLINQHKMVYDAIGSYMGNELHALKINTKVK
jgi:stress-induced morphogen